MQLYPALIPGNTSSVFKTHLQHHSGSWLWVGQTVHLQHSLFPVGNLSQLLFYTARVICIVFVSPLDCELHAAGDFACFCSPFCPQCLIRNHSHNLALNKYRILDTNRSSWLPPSKAGIIIKIKNCPQMWVTLKRMSPIIFSYGEWLLTFWERIQ